MLTDDQIEQYRKNGVLHLPGFIAGAELAALRAASDRVMEEAIAYGRELDQDHPIQLKDDHGFAEWEELDDRKFLYGRGKDGERVWRRAEEMWQRDVAFRNVTANPDLLRAVEQVLGQSVVPSNDSMVVKMPGAGAAVPWHRDPNGNFLIERDGDACSDFTCDIYLDPSTKENGALWAIPGSHRGGWDNLEELDFNIPEAVLLEAQPGDILFHSTGVLHGSPPNRSGGLRRTFYVHYRPPSVLAGEWWNRPAEWIEGQQRFLEEIIAERASS